MAQPPEKKQRLFIGVPVERGESYKFRDFQLELAEYAEYLRFTPSEQLHFTIRFLGTVLESQIPIIIAAMKKVWHISEFTLYIEKLVVMGEKSGERSVIATRLSDSKELRQVCSRLDEELIAAGIIKKGNETGVRRAFLPHVTIAREIKAISQEQIEKLPIMHKNLSWPRQTTSNVLPVAKVVLFESVQEKTGMRYQSLFELPLRKPNLPGYA